MDPPRPGLERGSGGQSAHEFDPDRSVSAKPSVVAFLEVDANGQAMGSRDAMQGPRHAVAFDPCILRGSKRTSTSREGASSDAFC